MGPKGSNFIAGARIPINQPVYPIGSMYGIFVPIFG